MKVKDIIQTPNYDSTVLHIKTDEYEDHIVFNNHIKSMSAYERFADYLEYEVKEWDTVEVNTDGNITYALVIWIDA